MIHEHMISTPATRQRCNRCQAELLVAVSEGITARVDVIPLSRAQEVEALVAGKWTYVLAAKELVYRDVDRIKGDSPTGTIHVEHQCTKIRQLEMEI